MTDKDPDISIATTDETAELMTEEELDAIKKKSVKGAMSFFVRTAFLQGLGIISALILSAFFSPEDFGIYGFVIQIIGILIFFSDIGLAAALIQKKKRPTLTEYRTAFTVQQILSWIIFGIVLLILSTGFVQAKTGNVGAWILIALAISFPLATLKTISSVRLERKLDFSKLVVPQIFEQIVFHGLLIIFAWSGMGAIAYAYSIIARSVVGAGVMYFIEPWKIGLAWNKTAFKTLVGFGAKFQINDFLARIKDQLFFLFLGTVLPIRQFGYISWAKNWSLYPYNLTVQNVMAITFPTFSRLQGNKQALKRAIEKSLFFISLVIFPILVGMSIFMVPLVSLIEEYNKWQPAVLSLGLFSLSVIWGAISSPLVNTLNAIGKINSTLKLMTFWTVLTWVVTPLMLWKFGYDGVAMAAFAISFTSILPVIMVKKIVPIEPWEQVWRQLVAVLIMGVVSWFLIPFWQQSLANLGLGVIISGAIYGVIFLGLGFNKLRFELEALGLNFTKFKIKF